MAKTNSYKTSLNEIMLWFFFFQPIIVWECPQNWPFSLILYNNESCLMKKHINWHNVNSTNSNHLDTSYPYHIQCNLHFPNMFFLFKIWTGSKVKEFLCAIAFKYQITTCITQPDHSTSLYSLYIAYCSKPYTYESHDHYDTI